MTAIPEVLDALVAAWRNAQDLAGLRPNQVYDGPSVSYVGTEGVAVGTSREDNAVDFTWPGADLAGGSADRFTIPCLAWSGSGDVAMSPRRARVDLILDALEQHLAQDRTLRGVVSNAWITGGSLTQEINGGALVTVEFRVSVTRF